ncbi:MAG: hypothetical protein WBG38_09425 [Nodosilinea sp.]
MTSLDDLTLMQWFVSGDATLEANQSLRIQPVGSLRLLTSRHGLPLATAYDADTPPRIEVRRDTDYTDVLNQILVDHHFVPTGQAPDQLCYAHYPVPEGYRIVYSQARQLWQLWWSHSSRLSDRSLQLDLFVLTQKQWYPVRDIVINSGRLHIETLKGETVHHGDDMMVWLEKDIAEEVEKTQSWAAPKPSATTGPAAPLPLPQSAQAKPAPASVVCRRDGKIYVKTPAGVVVIEGDNLKAYSLETRPAAAARRRS